MSHRYIDDPNLYLLILHLIGLSATACGIVLGALIANAPFFGANVGCAIGCLIVGKLMFAKAKPSADPSPSTATQPEE
jgi:hypothetical protein